MLNTAVPSASRKDLVYKENIRKARHQEKKNVLLGLTEGSVCQALIRQKKAKSFFWVFSSLLKDYMKIRETIVE